MRWGISLNTLTPPSTQALTELFPTWLRLAELQYVAWASFPARHGQQRGFRRILHALSCAFARSSNARSLA
jgi:hypothetical protein